MNWADIIEDVNKTRSDTLDAEASSPITNQPMDNDIITHVDCQGQRQQQSGIYSMKIRSLEKI